MSRRLLLVLLMFSAAAVSCGRKGDPLPPVIRVAERTRDLAVVQEDGRAVLRWSYPSMTRDGGPLPDLEAVEVWRAVLPRAQEPQATGARRRSLEAQILESRGERIAVLDPGALERATRGPSLVFSDDLSGLPEAAGEGGPVVVWYAVRSVCCRGRVSGFSNVARLEPQAPPRPPTQLVAEATRDAIVLTWSPVDGLPVLVERSPEDGGWERLTAEPVASPPWRDTTARQGATWRYRLRSVATTGGTAVIGEPSKPVVVAYPDVYPPEAPGELVCLPEEGSVRLRWEAASGAAAYVVLRKPEGGTRWTLLADGLEELRYHDTAPPPGSLTYAVRAVDAAGNRSDPAVCTTLVGRAP